MRKPPASAMAGRAAAAGSANVPVCGRPISSRTRTVAATPAVPRSRQWLLAVVTNPTPAHCSASA